MISRGEIEQLAQLSRLQLSDGEIDELQKDFASILDYVGQISAFVGEKSSSPATTSSSLRNVMREDREVKASASSRDMILREAPRRDGDYIVVRKIISKDEPTL